VTASSVAANLVGANPGPLVHITLLGIVVVVALVVFGIVRWRNKREAAEAAVHSSADSGSKKDP